MLSALLVGKFKLSYIVTINNLNKFHLTNKG